MAQNPVVTIQMEDKSIIKAELFPEIAPNPVNNFIHLIQQKYYDFQLSKKRLIIGAHVSNKF